MAQTSVKGSATSAQWASRLSHTATTFGVLVALVGAGHLVAWVSGYMVNRGVSTVTMKTNTALALLLEGLALVLLASPQAELARRWAGRGLAALAALIGFLSLGENLLGWNLGIDQLLAQEPPGALGVGAPNLMGTPASTSFVLAGLALLILSRRVNRGAKAVQGLALVACLIALLGTIGYMYGAQNFYVIARLTGIAWPTALALLMLSLGLLLVRPTQGMMAQVTADDPGGANLRRWLPVLLMPVVLGWLRLVGERLGLFDAATGTALMMIIFIGALAILAYTGARPVSRSSADLQRQREWLRVTLSSIGDAVIATDRIGKITFLNPVAEGLTGWKEHEVLGRPGQEVFRIINEQTRQPAEDIVQQVLLEGHVVALANHTALITKDGCQIPIEDSAAPIKDPAGKVSGVVLVFHDVTQKRRAQEVLRESEERLRVTLTSIGDAVVTVDPTGRVAFLNPVAVTLTGWEPEDAIGQPIQSVFNIINEQTQHSAEDIVQRVLLEGHVVALANHTALVTKNGSQVPIEDSAAPIKDEDGKVSGVVLVFHDVTEKRRAHGALLESEKRYRNLFDSMAEAFALHEIVTDEQDHPCDYRFLDVNNSFERMTGLKRSDIVNRNVREVLPGIENFWIETYGKVALTGEPVNFEKYYPAPLDRWYEVFAYRPGPRQFAAVFLDVSQRKRAEEALRERERLLQTVIDGSTSPIFLKDLEGKFITINASLERMLGMSREEIKGKTDYDIAPKEVADYWRTHDKQVMATRNAIQIEEVADLQDGHHIFLANKFPLVDVDGQTYGVASISHDITERKQVEEELYILNKTLEDRVTERTVETEQRALQLRQLAAELALAEQRERQRISLVLHDGLQQILVAAKFHIALLEKTKDVQKLTAELAGLIDDGIETSRSLTAELSPPILKQGGLVPALEWLVKWMRDKHGLTVSLASHGKIESAPEDVVILLFQSVRELLFNAAKHAGVRTARVEVMQEAGRIRVDVEDEGVGFDPMPLIKEGARSRGMGLFSIQERLSYLGGSLEIDSAPGRGSRFKLITPPISMKTAVPMVDKQPIVSISMAPQLKTTVGLGKMIGVILADDHMVMRQGLAGLLGAEPDIEIIGEASDGQSAIDLIRELRPDVVLMDISMPGMDGIQATRIIHKELPEVRIIGLSMFQEREREAAMREAGVVDYLTKSGLADALIEAIRACVQKSIADKPVKKVEQKSRAGTSS